MNNIYTICEELLTEHGNEEFEASEIADCPTVAFSVEGGQVTWQGSVTDTEAEYLMRKYKLDFLLPTFDIDLSIIGYHVNGEFFLFAVFVNREEEEMSPKRRSDFLQLFNTNRENVKMRHVPGLNGAALKLDGAVRALKNGSKMEDVVHYTTKAIVELCSGISPMTKQPRKGFAFKSTTSDYKFKAYSEAAMNQMGSL
jgi:hypothetical protein